MKILFSLYIILFFVGCLSRNRSLMKIGEAGFRITLSDVLPITNAEIYSTENSKPYFPESDTTNTIYQLLSRLGFVENRYLDTTGLQLRLLTWEKPKTRFGDVQILLDTTGGKHHIIYKEKNNEFRAELGPKLLGDIFVCYTNLNNDHNQELLVLEKHYVMGGYNFDFIMFEVR